MPEDDDPTSAIGRGWKSTYLANDRGDLYTTITIIITIIITTHQHHYHHRDTLFQLSQSTNPTLSYYTIINTWFEIIIYFFRNGRKSVTFFRIIMGMARRW